MAKKRSEKCMYKSPYNPESWVTEAQYICELVCYNAARKEYKDLPLRFWKLDRWKKYYMFQIIHVNRVLKKFEASAIISVFKKNKHFYSIAPKWLEKVIQAEQEKIGALRERAAAQPAKPEAVINPITRKSTMSNKMNRLLDLDGEL